MTLFGIAGGMRAGWLLFSFFFSSRRRHTRFDCDWSSDVCSSDLMLGEAARTMEDAERYRAAYGRAIAAIGKAAAGRAIEEAPGISVKLSALFPRYEMAQHGRIMRELL